MKNVITFSAQTTGEFDITPHIPGMPISPPMPSLSTNLQASVSSINLNSPPQAQVVTTPISLPGMPPITVSASVPQNPPFYSPGMQQNQISGGNIISPSTQ